MFFINLNRSPDRLADMMHQFGKVAVKVPSMGEVVRVAGVDGAVPRLWTRANRGRGSCIMTPAQVGCVLSHIRAIHHAYVLGCERALIMEDDMELLRWPTDRLFESAPAGWEILQLFVKGKAGRRIYSPPSARLWVPWEIGMWNTGAYAITRIGMARVLVHTLSQGRTWPPLPLPLPLPAGLITVRPLEPGTNRCNADVLLYMLCKTYSCTDLLFVEKEVPSTIKIGRENDVADMRKDVKKWIRLQGYLDPSVGVEV